MSDKEIAQLSSDKVSFNSRAVLLGLFILVGFVLLVFTVSINIIPSAQSGRLNNVFIAAVSGSLALGGTLISQLWGKPTAGGSPSIFATYPDNTKTGVPQNIVVSASFNMLMDPSTLNTKTFSLKEANLNVDGLVTLEGGNAIFRPTIPLKPLTTYAAKISKDVKSVTGKSMDSDKDWKFTTEADKSKPATNPPKLDNQRVSTKVNSPVNIILNATPSDVGKLAFIKVTDPSKGKLSGFEPSTGNVTYTPDKDYVGSDSFTFKTNDTKMDSNVAIVSITISNV